MTREEMNALYLALENFIADIPYEEYKANEDTIKKMQTLIHQRMRK